jgi:hypothetical protein
MTAVRFTERMKGWVDFDQRDFNQAYLHGKRAGRSCEFRLDVEVPDIDRFTSDPAAPASATGTLTCPELGGAMAVERGVLNLFVKRPDERRKCMLYRLFARDAEGRPLTLSGYKVLSDERGHDIRYDSSRLLTRLYAGHVPDEAAEATAKPLATGVLEISRTGFTRLMLSMSTSADARREHLRAKARFGWTFARGLAAVYRGPAVGDAEVEYPGRIRADTSLQGRRPNEWHALPERPGLVRRIVPFTAGDGHRLNLHNIRADGVDDPPRGPVLMIAGTSVRANILYGSPAPTSLVDTLAESGYDVWIENWRASIDLPRDEYVLDDAALHDHPAAVRTILRDTGRETLRAMVHCQGSTSFMMSAIAGLVPEVTAVVSNAVSLHVELTPLSRRKVLTLVPAASLQLDGIDPQWAVLAPSTVAASMAGTARLLRRECDNPVCALSTFMYGAGPDVLWLHHNLDDATHEWVSREFGWAPMSFFKSLGRSVAAGHLVRTVDSPKLPPDFAAATPETDARFTFLAGSDNTCFLPSGQRRTFEHFDAHRPGYHAHHELPGYSHLDVFFGRRAHRDVFPVILEALDRGP